MPNLCLLQSNGFIRKLTMLSFQYSYLVFHHTDSHFIQGACKGFQPLKKLLAVQLRCGHLNTDAVLQIYVIFISAPGTYNNRIGCHTFLVYPSALRTGYTVSKVAGLAHQSILQMIIVITQTDKGNKPLMSFCQPFRSTKAVLLTDLNISDGTCFVDPSRLISVPTS